MGSYVSAETEGRVRIQVGHEVDTNPQRVVSPLDTDHLARMVLEGEVLHTSGAHRFSANYLGGFKLHYNQSSEDLIATQLTGAYSFVASSSWLLGSRLAFLDTSLRDHDRDYRIWSGDLFFRARLMSRLSLIVYLGGRYFDFKPDRHDLYQLKFSYQGPVGELRLHAELGERLVLTSFYQLEGRFFKDRAYRIEDQLEKSEKDRLDLHHLAGLLVNYEFDYIDGRIMLLEVSYCLSVNDSNSVGSSAIWHRLRLTASMQLPLDMILHVLGTLQLTQLTDGLYIEGNMYEPDADENENSLVVRLSVPLWERLSLVIQAGLYRNDFHASSLDILPFRRETIMLGLGYELPF